jgi:hypothetical protein
MPYHLRELPQYKCRCGKPARVELYNDRNAPMGTYCKPCGARALREELQKQKRIARGNPW